MTEQAFRPPPNYPVIVVHLMGPGGYTACSGHPMPDPAAPIYDSVPRYLCVACERAGAR